MADLCSCFFCVYYPTACNFICYFLHAIGGRQAGPGWRQLRKQMSRGRKKPWVLSWVCHVIWANLFISTTSFFFALGCQVSVTDEEKWAGSAGIWSSEARQHCRRDRAQARYVEVKSRHQINEQDHENLKRPLLLLPYRCIMHVLWLNV